MSVRRVAVVTGTRAEFGLLTPVMRAIASHDGRELRVVACGMHMVGPLPTIAEVERLFPVDATVQMQVEGMVGRADDARALGRGVVGCADAYERLEVDVVVVLGDRIEAMAAATAGSVMGLPVAHLHGGDVAEGVADEAMRHAITKLAHLHLPATEQSAQRIERMGEPRWRIERVGSPAADVVRGAQILDDDAWRGVGSPEAVGLHHPCGLGEEEEIGWARAIAPGVGGMRTLWLAPNHDPGRAGVLREREGSGAVLVDHLPSAAFTGMLKRLAREGGVLVGNSSCALIEGAIIGLGCVDVGPRQSGRERWSNVEHVARAEADAVREAVTRARAYEAEPDAHPYGDGCTGERVASALAVAEFSDPRWLRKRNAY